MSRSFGPALQNGYVVRDLDAAISHWTRTLGVGPFFLLESVRLPEFRYRGEPTDAVVSFALAFSGDLEIELIAQHDRAPSMYRDFLEAGREGLQHVGYLSRDFDRVLAGAEATGLEIVQSARGFSAGTRAVYLSTEAHPGTVVELIEASERAEAFHRRIREASIAWDGREPVRRIQVPPTA